MTFDYSNIREHSPDLTIGDNVVISNSTYTVTSKQYETTSTECIPTVSYILEQVGVPERYYFQAHVNIGPYEYRYITANIPPPITMYSSPICHGNETEEISEETRKEFMKLLE